MHNYVFHLSGIESKISKQVTGKHNLKVHSYI